MPELNTATGTSFQGKTLEEIMVQSEYGVTLVPGSSDSALARLTRLQLLGLIHALSALDDCDYLVVDTAAGISDNVTVLFGARIKLLLIQNELSSIAEAATVKVLQQEFNLSDIMLTPVQVTNERIPEHTQRINKVTAQFLGISLNTLRAFAKTRWSSTQHGWGNPLFCMPRKVTSPRTFVALST